MTFGLIKSIIEENLIESYKDEKSFKKAVNEFKHNVLSNKDISKVYSLYDDLSKPQGLSVEDAKDYLSEGIMIIQTLLKNIKLPKIIGESKVKNKYQYIDDLVYLNNHKIGLTERVNIRKNIVNILSEQVVSLEPKVNIPLKAMVKVANQTLNSYIESLDETTKKEFLEIIKEDAKTLEVKFNNLKETALSKLSPIVENENDVETKTKLQETISKIENDNFNQINFLRLKKLTESL